MNSTIAAALIGAAALLVAAAWQARATQRSQRFGTPTGKAPPADGHTGENREDALTPWRVIDAGIPAVIFIFLLVLIFQVRAAHGNVAHATRRLSALDGGTLLLLAAAVALFNILTDGLRDGALRLLEGYWGHGRVMNALANARCRAHLFRRDALRQRASDLTQSAFHFATPEMLASGIPIAWIESIAALLEGRRPPTSGDRKLAALDWMDFAPVDTKRGLYSLSRSLRNYPAADDHLLPTRLGNTLAAVEERVQDRALSGNREDRLLLTGLTQALRMEHDRLRSRLELYCILTVLFTITGIVGVVAFAGLGLMSLSAVALSAVVCVWLSYRCAVWTAERFDPLLDALWQVLRVPQARRLVEDVETDVNENAPFAFADNSQESDDSRSHDPAHGDVPPPDTRRPARLKHPLRDRLEAERPDIAAALSDAMNDADLKKMCARKEISAKNAREKLAGTALNTLDELEASAKVELDRLSAAVSRHAEAEAAAVEAVIERDPHIYQAVLELRERIDRLWDQIQQERDAERDCRARIEAYRSDQAILRTLLATDECDTEAFRSKLLATLATIGASTDFVKPPGHGWAWLRWYLRHRDTSVSQGLENEYVRAVESLRGRKKRITALATDRKRLQISLERHARRAMQVVRASPEEFPAVFSASQEALDARQLARDAIRTRGILPRAEGWLDSKSSGAAS